MLVALALAAASPGFLGCRSFVAPGARPVRRSASIVFACGDGNFYATGLRWSRWDGSVAVASGTGHQNDCTPYCAAGHFHTYRVVVRLTRPERCGARRQLEFTRVSWLFPAARPRGVAASGSESFRCS